MESELIDLVRSNPWPMRVLGAVRDASLADAWVGAGVLRDLVCGERYGLGLRPDRVRDVDVALVDPHRLSRANDDRATNHLAAGLPAATWEAKNLCAPLGLEDLLGGIWRGNPRRVSTGQPRPDSPAPIRLPGGRT